MGHTIKRIAVACRWLNGFGGTTTGILERTRRLSREGWEVHFFAERIEPERAREAGGIPHRLWGWPWGKHWKRRFFAWNFERAAGTRYDLVEGHGDTLSQDVLALHNCVHAAHEAIFGAPLPADSSVGRLHERILREDRFQRLIANSRLMKEELTRRFNLSPKKIDVVYPGFESLQFQRKDREIFGRQKREELGVREGELLIGLVTSGDFKKRGVDLFIQALAGLRPELRSKVNGLVVGKEKRLSDYQRMAQQANLGDRILFLPAAPKVQQIYHALDVFLYPALYEEFGQSVQEAMACGLPVLTSRRVGAAELLEKAGKDVVLERPETTLFTRKLETLMESSDLRRQWGDLSAAAVQENDWDVNFKRTREIYDSLLPRR